MVSVLFVCMGNICRSPTAQGVFEKYVAAEGLNNHINVDSAGTHAYHVGEQPDIRAQKSALARNIDISHIRARKAIENDFLQFDYILAMDRENYQNLLGLCPQDCEHKLRLFLSFAPQLDVEEVPDPYYGGPKGFENVLDLIEEASKALLMDIKNHHLNNS